MNVSPNPAFDKINVQITNNRDKAWTIKLLNTFGQTVALEKGQNSGNVIMDTRHLHNGLYIVEYQSSGERFVEKVLVQH